MFIVANRQGYEVCDSFEDAFRIHQILNTHIPTSLLYNEPNGSYYELVPVAK